MIKLNSKYKVENDVEIGGYTSYTFYESEVYTVTSIANDWIVLLGKVLIVDYGDYTNNPFMQTTNVYLTPEEFKNNFTSVLKLNINELLKNIK